jgi:hypothetical protein
MSKACRKSTTPIAAPAGNFRPLTRRTASTTACPVAAQLLQDEHAAIVAISTADDARPLPIREFLAFERAQAARLEHEDACALCQREISGRAA